MLLLRIAPVITSTATLTYAWDQELFLRPFVRDSIRSKANPVLPEYATTWLERGYWMIVILYPASLTLSLANIFAGHRPDVATQRVYWAGAAFTIGHFLFGQKAIRLLHAIESDESKGNSTDDLKSWLDNNAIRSFAVDLPAWLSFVAAAMMSLKL